MSLEDGSGGKIKDRPVQLKCLLRYAESGMPVTNQNVLRIWTDSHDKKPSIKLSRALSASRASRKPASIDITTGLAPPRTRRAVRSASWSVLTASPRSSSVGPQQCADNYHDPHKISIQSSLEGPKR